MEAKNRKRSDILIEKLMIMTDKISKTGKISRKFNTDIEIYRSEIHTIKLIGDHKQLHVSELARKMGVTKGAVSQLLKKLEKKELIQKDVDETNNTRLLVTLTKKGKAAYQGHEAHHVQYDRELWDFLKHLDETEFKTVMTFIDLVIGMTDEHL